MDEKKNTTLYNLFLPIWMLIFTPTYLWILLIPANYIFDRIILSWGLGPMENKSSFLRHHTWKICLVGFLSDFAGAVIMALVFVISVLAPENNKYQDIIDKLTQNVGFNPFGDPISFIIVMASDRKSVV